MRYRVTASVRADREIRAENLRLLGFKSYNAYLRSPLWARIRAQVLERDKSICRFCGGEARQVHHGNYFYLTMNGENLNYLYAVCHICHLKGSFSNRKKVLLSSRSATRRMKHRGKFYKKGGSVG